MKKLRFICNLCITLISTIALADASSNLQHRLDKINSFYATFNHKVNDHSGLSIQESKGELWVKKPNKFYWHTTEPDENIIISDGKILWIYNPLIEQVTIHWLSDIGSNTPFTLIASNKQSNWQQYTIEQRKDTFILTPKKSNENLKQFTINISRNGIINEFSFLDQNKQRSSYLLNKQNNKKIGIDKFTFVLPRGVTIDDQRW